MKPFRCLPLSICPEGSSRQVITLSFLFIALFDIFLVIACAERTFKKAFLSRVATKLKVTGRRVKTFEDQLESKSEDIDIDTFACMSEPFYPSMENMKTEIRVQGICKEVGSSREEILHQQDVLVRDGSFLGVMGPSGSGKSKISAYLRVVQY